MWKRTIGNKREQLILELRMITAGLMGILATNGPIECLDSGIFATNTRFLVFIYFLWNV